MSERLRERGPGCVPERCHSGPGAAQERKS